jgi:hypothetical protein
MMIPFPIRRVALIVGLALIGGLGCAEDSGTGRVVGSLTVPDCREGMQKTFVCSEDIPLEQCEAFDLQASFFALQVFEERGAKMRIQRSGEDFALTDALVFEIRDTRLLRGRLGEVLEVKPDGNIRAGLGLFELCPDSTQSYELRGSISFDDFGVEKGDRIRGRIQRLEVRDGRESAVGNAVLGLLRGDFDFTLLTGPPYERFPE